MSQQSTSGVGEATGDGGEATTMQLYYLKYSVCKLVGVKLKRKGQKARTQTKNGPSCDYSPTPYHHHLSEGPWVNESECHCHSEGMTKQTPKAQGGGYFGEDGLLLCQPNPLNFSRRSTQGQ